MTAVALLASLTLVAQEGGKGDPDRVVAGGKMAKGWSVRPDRGAGADINFTETGTLMHFAMGSAGTFYNPAWTKTGNYKFSARLTQLAAPSHPISYGLVIGGKDLATANQNYTYFLVRNSGEFYIANRDSDARPTAVVPWTANAAIAKQGADGKQANVLGIEAQGDNVIFSVNGTEVNRQPKSKVHADGLFGFRIGHNLDVDVDQVSK